LQAVTQQFIALNWFGRRLAIVPLPKFEKVTVGLLLKFHKSFYFLECSVKSARVLLLLGIIYKAVKKMF
jgi:hypothetical protein